jgi:23S rRNA pseudouridine2605 synthase
MRQTGLGTLTLEDARTWIEETGLCLFLPKRQFSSSVAPSFVEAVVGRQEATPDPKQIALAEELLVRLELDGVAVRLNLLGQPGEHPDFVVAAWVLPYVYALRGDRDWRRSPQLTGSRQVSQLAIMAYKQLEGDEATISQLKQGLGREVSEVAVLRAITELWQQLRIIPVIAAPGQAAKWQLLRTRFQRAIAEGASTSQVTAISVLASIYLQAVISASMEDVELFLAPLTARSKIREVLRGLVATRQVHTISMGHAPHFYVAGTLPEFEIPATLYASSSVLGSTYFNRSFDREDEFPSRPVAKPVVAPPVVTPAPVVAEQLVAERPHVARTLVRRPAVESNPEPAKPHFSRPTSHTRDRKSAPASRAGQASNGGRPVRRSADDRPAAGRTQSGSRPAAGTRWSQGTHKGANGNGGNGNGKLNGNHAASSNGTRSNGRTSNGNGATRPTGTRSAGNGSNGSGRTVKASATWGKRNGHASSVKSSAKPSSAVRKGATALKDSRPARGGRKPVRAAGAGSRGGKRFGLSAQAKQGTKKRG